MFEQMLKNMGFDLNAMQILAGEYKARFEVMEKKVDEIHAMLARQEELMSVTSSHEPRAINLSCEEA